MRVLVNRVALLASLLAGAATLAAAGAAAAVPARPAPAGPVISELNGVSCTSPSACTAVGGFGHGTASAPLAERWNGTKWAIQRTPKRAGATFSALFGVSCTSPTACIAVGYSSRSGVAAALAEQWNGTKWAILRTPRPAGAKDTQLFGISCTSRTACTAVGNSNYGRSLAERWNGKKWTIQPTPKPAGKIYRLTFFNSVSCTSSTVCTAVGESDTGLPFKGKNTTYLALAEQWNGKKWRIQQTPRAPAPTERFLYGVSCQSRTVCTGVGDTFLATAMDVVLAERWNGTKWTVQPAPTLAGGFPAEFGGVSCASAAACTAVGASSHSANFILVAENWNGATWKLELAPKPAGEFYAALFSVSCAAPAACIAVGDANNGSGHAEVPMTQRWNGATWTLLRTPVP